MPSQNQGGSQRQRRRFDDDLADEAARWLDWDLLNHKQRRQVVRSIIKGIDRIERVNAWQVAEEMIAHERGREPRAKILQWLDQRREWLELHGDRDERLQEREEPRDLPPVETSYPDREDVDEPEDRATFQAERAFGSLRDRYPHLFDGSDNAAESAANEAVATDGGDDS